MNGQSSRRWWRSNSVDKDIFPGHLFLVVFLICLLWKCQVFDLFVFVSCDFNGLTNSFFLPKINE